MASSDESVDALFEQIASAEDLPDWERPEDLHRISEVALLRNQGLLGVDMVRPAGRLRLSGPGGQGSTVGMQDAGQAIALTQRLITSIGAALEGAKALVGQFNATVLSRTRLGIVANPSPARSCSSSPRCRTSSRKRPRGSGHPGQGGRPAR